MARDQLREDVRRVLRFLRRLPAEDPLPPVPPPLPDGRTIRVDRRGEMFFREVPGEHGQPTIVLLHGWTLSADLNWFSGGYDVAARRGRVIAPDIRGHGRGLRSDQPFTLEAAAEDVMGLLEALAATPAILVGYSMGGSIAMLCAEHHPDRVAGLVLASAGLQWRSSLWERIEWIVLGMTEYVLRFGAPEGITERYLRHAVEQSPDLEPYLGWVKAEARRGDPSDIGHAARAMAEFDARKLAERLSVPTGVVVTNQDLLIRRRRQEQLCHAIKNARTVSVKGRHNAWMVKPDDWSAAVEEALEFVISSADRTAADPARRAKERPASGDGAGRSPVEQLQQS